MGRGLVKAPALIILVAKMALLTHDTLAMTVRFIVNRTCLSANIPRLQLQYENKMF